MSVPEEGVRLVAKQVQDTIPLGPESSRLALLSVRSNTSSRKARPVTRGGDMKREKLTAKQEKVFRFLASHFAKHQRMPTLREVSEHMGFASLPSFANSHLVALERKGFIRLNRAKGTKGAARGFEIVGLAEAIAPVVEKHVEETLKESKS